MKFLSCFMLTVIVIQGSSAQQLRCFECDDCERVGDDTPTIDCYEPMAEPTTQTNPPTISLTPVMPTTVSGVDQQIVHIPTENNTDIIGARASQLFTCFTISWRDGIRRVTTRGCTLVHRDEEYTCRYWNRGEDPEFCDLCVEDECNENTAGVNKLIIHVSLILSTLMLTMNLT